MIGATSASAPDVDLRLTNLARCNFADGDLRGSVFYGCDLTEVDFSRVRADHLEHDGMAFHEHLLGLDVDGRGQRASLNNC